MKRLLLSATLFLCSLFTYAQLLGSGTEGDPYMIYDADDLNEVRDYVGVEGIYFQLANDIDLSAYSEGEGWEPIGSSGAQFKGIFDGNGYTIYHLKINRSSTDYVGLFGYTVATICNLTVECEIIGRSYIGAVCGYSSGGTISNVKVNGTIEGKSQYVGGICGYGYASITKCKVTADNISGEYYVGGITGYSCADISNCMVDGYIITNNSWAGGIVGYLNKGNSIIYDCVFSGSVNGRGTIGGICGYVNYATSIISRCFTYSSVKGVYVVGGICGSGFSNDYYNLSIQNCVAANISITAITDYENNNNYGRIIGSCANTQKIKNNLSLSTTKIIVDDKECTVSDNDYNGTGVGNAMLMRKSTYTDLGWDFNEVWDIDEGTSYPYLRHFNPTIAQSIYFETPTLTYGDKNYTLPLKTNQGLSIKWTSSDENVATISGNTLTIKGAGEFYLIAEQSGNNVYKSIRKTYPVTIAKAPLRIMADNYRRDVGEDNPKLTFSYSGFVYDEDESVLTTLPSISTNATTDSPAGVYPITVSGAEAANYAITYVNGTLTILDEASLRNTLSTAMTTLRAGNNATFAISLDNQDTMIAFEFYIQLPEGINISLDDDGYPDVVLNSERSNRHTLEVSDEGDGLYHFLCYSNRNNALKGNSGELVSIKIVCEEGVEPGSYSASIHTIKFSDVNKNRIILPNMDINIEVSNVTMGDVNDDGEIDVMDVVDMVDYIMGNNPSNFLVAAADHDGDGLVDVMDLVEQVSLVMDQVANAPSTIFDQQSSNLSLMTEDDGVVTLNINDAAHYVASQFIVTLSEGQHLASVSTDNRHKVSFEPIAPNQYVVVSYSTNNDAYTCNKALMLHVEGEGYINVEKVTFVRADKTKVSFQNTNSEFTDGIRCNTYDFSQPADIYTTTGVLMHKNATSVENLKKGVYIVNGKKHIVK